MRTFIALGLGQSYLWEVAGLARQLRESVDARFVAEEGYHLTLAFLGEVGELEARRAMAVMDTVCVGRTPMPLVSDGLGIFGPSHDATLWLAIRPDPSLMSLAEGLRGELDARGLWYDRSAFKPHVTLARRARISRGSLGSLAFPAPAQSSSLTLYRSLLSCDGATYKPLYTVSLGG